MHVGGRGRGETKEEARTEERTDEAFTFDEHLTVVGRKLRPGEAAPDFCLHSLDLVDMAVHTVRLSDSTGLVRLLSVVNSLERPVCQVVTRQWEALCVALPPDACIYTVSMDLPQMQVSWQDRTGVMHQTLSAHHRVQFGQDYGLLRKRVAPPAEVSRGD